MRLNPHTLFLQATWTICRSPVDDGGAAAPAAGDPPAPAADPAAPPADPAPAAGADSQPAPAGDPPAPKEGDEPASILGGDEPADDKEAEPPKADDKAGPPEAYDLKMPEGVTLDAATLEAATPILKELGLTNEQGQQLADLYAKDILPKVTEAVTAQIVDQQVLAAVSQAKDWHAACIADPRIGDGKQETFEKAISDVSRALDQFGSPELRTLFRETPFGNHPEIVAVFAKVGRALADDQFHGGNPAPGGERSLTSIFYGDTHPKTT